MVLPGGQFWNHYTFVLELSSWISEYKVIVLGGVYWLKLPSLARHHSNYLHEVLVRNLELISHHKLEEFGEGQKEMPHVWAPPRIRLDGPHRGWTPGRTLSQNDWLKTTRKLIPSPWNPVAEQFSWVPLTYFSPPRCPFPIKSLALSAQVSPQTIHFQVLDKSPVAGPGRGPHSCNSRSQLSRFWSGRLQKSLIEWFM